jgi:hypothetical protein
MKLINALDYVEDLLSPERIKKVGFFDPEKVQQLLAKGRSHNLSRVGNRDNMAFVLIVSTMLLNDQFVDRQPPQAPSARSSSPQMTLV